MSMMAFAAAAAPPRISLNLEGMSQAYKLQTPILRQPDSNATTSRQDWTEKCAANRICNAEENSYGPCTGWTETSKETCPFPKAHGYDHVDKEVKVTTRIYLVDFDGTPVAASNCGTADLGSLGTWDGNACGVYNDSRELDADHNSNLPVNFDYRSTYLFKYDASDSKGNHAEQVVFALILDDTEAPFFKSTCETIANKPTGNAFNTAITVQAASDWSLCKLEAVDNVDSAANVRSTDYQIEYLGRDLDANHNNLDGSTENSQCLYEESNSTFVENSPNGNTRKALTDHANVKQSWAVAEQWFADHGKKHVGKYLVTYTTTDQAGIYGHNAEDNERSVQQAILVRDTDAPTIYLMGHSPKYTECVQPTNTTDGLSVSYETLQAGDKWAPYQFEEAWCRDALDTDALERYLVATTTIQGVTDGSHTTGNCQTSFFNYTAGQYVGGATHDQNDHGGAKLNNWALGMNTVSSLTQDQQIAKKKETILDYTCHDTSGNDAVTVSRTVVTVDTNAPTLLLVHNNAAINNGTAGFDVETHVVLYIQTNDVDSANYNVKSGNTTDLEFCDSINESSCDSSHDDDIQNHNAVWAQDSCDTTITNNSVTMSWGPRPFNSRQLGDYVRTYTVSDAADNVRRKTRTYTVIDRADPVITVMGDESIVLEATRDSEYTDTGATCQDFVDGELSHAVEVSGEVVNMRIPGTYQITYNCQDLSGNSAPTETRTVVVEDTTNPLITLVGASLNYVEAGFPYVDGGATATDTLDGDITQYVWTSGNTINHASGVRNCAEITAAGGGELRQGAYLVEKNGDNGNTYSVTCIQNGTSVIGIFFAPVGETCVQHGFVQFTVLSATVTAYCDAVGDDCVNSATQQLCHEDDSSITRFDHPHMEQNTGVFKIQYHVEDKAGNSAATTPVRTVVVKDTLPPVITLRLKGELIHKSRGTQFGIGHKLVAGELGHAAAAMQLNPAGFKPSVYKTKTAYGNIPQYYKTNNFGNPQILSTDPAQFDLMAEQSTVNGWVIGAVVSAVAGVALLGFSAQKTATSVPV
jgi:hypothetical protein